MRRWASFQPCRHRAQPPLIDLRIMKFIFFLLFAAVASAFQSPALSLRAEPRLSRPSSSTSTAPSFGARQQTKGTFAINGEDTMGSDDPVDVVLRAVAQKVFPFCLSLICLFAPLPTLLSPLVVQHANAATIIDATKVVSPATTGNVVKPATRKSMLTIAAFPQRPSDPILDLAGVLDQESSNTLHQQIEAVQRDSQSAMMIVVTDEIQFGFTPKAMATSLFINWKLGKDAGENGENNNNAILVLAVLQKRRVEVEVSRGPLDTIMSNQWCTSMLKYEAVPSFRNEDYGNGLIYTTRAIAQRLQEEDIQVEEVRADPGEKIKNVLSFGFIGTLIAVEAVSGAYPNKQSCPECEENFLTWAYDGGEEWKTVVDATDKRPGKIELPCRCKKCNYQTKVTKTVRQYDGRRVSDNGRITYYFYDSGNSDGGGDSGSSDGGGGADW